jgi:DNA polymerase elongation subunit (family B)
MTYNKPKILVFDVETAPITAHVWGLWDQNISLNQIKSDWHFLSWAAKWYNEPASEIIYMDNSNAKNIQDDKELIKGLWNLLDQADIVIAQNGDKFDIKKFNARAAIHGLPPVSPFKSTDTLKESKKVFSFTSHSLEYMSEALNTKYKKLKHDKYPGFELWKAVLNGDKKAWAEMKVYCIHDVLATEELYKRIQGWIKTQNIACFFDDAQVRCRCGSINIYKKGFVFTDAGKFQGYKCKDCGKRPKGRINLLTTTKKKVLLKEGK